MYIWKDHNLGFLLGSQISLSTLSCCHSSHGAQHTTWSKVRWNCDEFMFMARNSFKTHYVYWNKLFLSIIWIIKTVPKPSKSEANRVKLKHQINSRLAEVVTSFRRLFLRDWIFLSYMDATRMQWGTVLKVLNITALFYKDLVISNKSNSKWQNKICTHRVLQFSHDPGCPTTIFVKKLRKVKRK